MIPIHDLYVFGCFGSGHQLFRPDQSRALGAELYDVERACDGTPVDATVQVEGALVACTVPPGWSYVTWWDRQGDSRLGSHTGILARGTWSAEQLVTAARAHAPWAFRVPVQVAAVVVVADTLPVSAEAPAQRLACLPGCWRPGMLGVPKLGSTLVGWIRILAAGPDGVIYAREDADEILTMDADDLCEFAGLVHDFTDPATVGCLAAWCREVYGLHMYASTDGGYWYVSALYPDGADVWGMSPAWRVVTEGHDGEGDAWAAAILATLEAQ